MPLDRLVLIMVAVFFGAAILIWLSVLLATAIQAPIALVVLIPIVIVAFIIWRVIADRVGSKEDDHYDRIEK